MNIIPERHCDGSVGLNRGKFVEGPKTASEVGYTAIYGVYDVVDGQVECNKMGSNRQCLILQNSERMGKDLVTMQCRIKVYTFDELEKNKDGAVYDPGTATVQVDKPILRKKAKTRKNKTEQ